MKKEYPLKPLAEITEEDREEIYRFAMQRSQEIKDGIPSKWRRNQDLRCKENIKEKETRKTPLNLETEMLVRILEETQMPDESPKASIGFQYNKSDAPGTALYNSFTRWKLLAILLKAMWVVIRRSN